MKHPVLDARNLRRSPAAPARTAVLRVRDTYASDGPSPYPMQPATPHKDQYVSPGASRRPSRAPSVTVARSAGAMPALPRRADLWRARARRQRRLGFGLLVLLVKFSMVRGHRALGGVIRCGRGGGRGCDGGGVADKDDSISTMSSS